MAAEDKIQAKKPEPSVRKKRKNYVIEDEIIKEIATKEITSQIKFEQRWSFLKAENLDKLYQQLLQEDHVDMKLLREFSKYYQRRRKTDQQMNFEEIPVPKLSSGNA